MAKEDRTRAGWRLLHHGGGGEARGWLDDGGGWLDHQGSGRRGLLHDRRAHVLDDGGCRAALLHDHNPALLHDDARLALLGHLRASQVPCGTRPAPLSSHGGNSNAVDNIRV